ncbi:MAG: endonuclease domain-containing protein [Ekhidna sp.]|uniref:endonuclease domain-containing protein n=1 Tax=Ekhidna sp. TaxID=2608089 RepID=UPI0032EC51B8
MQKKYSNNHYNKDLKALARNLRKNPTKAETVLWRELLSENRMMGYRFLRQRPIANYIVDFFSKELKLIIEVDGYTHQFEEVVEKDQEREGALRSLGFEVLRFEDSEVLNDINNVCRTIENWILDREESSPDLQRITP